MGTYDSQVATALRLIKAKGKSVLLVRVTNTEDADQPWRSDAPVEATESVDAVFLNLTQKDVETQHYIPGSEVHASDRKVLMAGAATATPPNLKDKIRDGSVEWTIKNVQELAPNGEQILYTLRVGR